MGAGFLRAMAKISGGDKMAPDEMAQIARKRPFSKIAPFRPPKLRSSIRAPKRPGFSTFEANCGKNARKRPRPRNAFFSHSIVCLNLPNGHMPY